jgi:hypothetical protein
MIDLDDKQLFWVGSLAALGFSLTYIAIIVLYLPLGTPPNGAEAWLVYMAEYTSTWWAILGLSVLSDFLLVPIGLALYVALQGAAKNTMLLSVAFVGLFVILDLTLTWTNYAALISLSTNYGATTNDTRQSVAVMAAAYPVSVVESDLLDIYNTITLSIGILAAGLVMQNAAFSKATAYLALATGILGIIAVVGPVFVDALAGTIIIASLLTLVWALFVGYDLASLSKK